MYNNTRPANPSFLILKSSAPVCANLPGVKCRANNVAGTYECVCREDYSMLFEKKNGSVRYQRYALLIVLFIE